MENKEEFEDAIPAIDKGAWRNAFEQVVRDTKKKEGFVSHSKQSFTIQLIPVFYLIPIKSLYKISQHGLIINDWSITFLCFSFRFIKYKVV